MINRNPSIRELKLFSLLWTPLFLGTFGGMWYRHNPTASVIIWGIGILICIIGLVSPRLIRALFVGLMVATFPLGWVMTRLVLTFIFFLLLTPVGILMRLMGRGGLKKEFDSDNLSYWQVRQPDGDGDRYFRQY